MTQKREGSGAPALQVMAEGAGLYSLEKKRMGKILLLSTTTRKKVVVK